MRLRDLEIALQQIDRSQDHEIRYEQYPTPASIVASILYSAEMDHNDIRNRFVVDLGCGDGIFALGAALLGASFSLGIDIQSKALKVSQQNSSTLGIEELTDWVLANVSSFTLQRSVDTVVCNPPFGVKKRGADVAFLETALSIARVIYSIHLAGEKNRIFLKNAIEEMGGTVTQIETFQFPIPKLYSFHKKARHLTRVDLYRIKSDECE
ncbi:MAG: methyltransferase [Candidatus Lokiarchaeota archaeon]|nr:methyltransferase [Candidatus Lokiarchaeota archaeon]